MVTFSKLGFSYNSREHFFVHFLLNLYLQNLKNIFPVNIFLAFYFKDKFKVFSHLEAFGFICGPSVPLYPPLFLLSFLPLSIAFCLMVLGI